MFVVPIQTYILIYKKIYEHWGVAGTLIYILTNLLSIVPESIFLTIKLMEEKKSTTFSYYPNSTQIVYKSRCHCHTTPKNIADEDPIYFLEIFVLQHKNSILLYNPFLIEKFNFLLILEYIFREDIIQ